MQFNRFSKIILCAAIAAAFSPTVQSAKADDDVVETRRTTTIDSSSGPSDGMRTTTTTTTRRSSDSTAGAELTAALSFSDAQSILQTVDRRRSEVDNKIVEARSAGTLTEEKASDLRRELDRIGAQISELKSQDNPSLARSLSLAQDLDALASQVSSVYRSYTFVPIIEGSHFTIFNGHVVQLDELAVRRIGLENKILGRLAAKKISYQQSIELRSDLNAIAAREDSCRSARISGNLSDREARAIYDAFDRVAAKLDSFSSST